MALTRVFGVMVTLILLWAQGSLAAVCSTSNPAYLEIQQSQYNRNVSCLTDLSCRPLGFKHDVFHYQVNGKSDPCVWVDNADGKAIEVMVQTTPPNSMICVQGDGYNTICQEGTINECKMAAGKRVYFKFFCQGQSCETTDVNFWYRLTLSPSNVDPENWCFGRSGTDFPDSLLAQFPNNYTPKPIQPPTPTSSASKITSQPILATVTSILILTQYTLLF
ncbi:uncharacterized protein TRIADDRAFT_55436 [Trichoplax adhaerens]|uniref:CUB domain-containing protein n=1 Tax=Trichoplax adhaerens TaxID=10228 RepID=B3RUW3_TRIAD|nr:hypothetical protein TRIADDRAFT_55436 [Trichoplax adhaerens]EDV25896.1 hypothetical protein TRIADDRAFT_55436 [Trichoplax adhaerens]|eukprot:XP_002111929.1 hypothetical protein TRIADDRAFT_55436 [Trichoplax adhaerens]